MADGGEGTVDTFVERGARRVSAQVHGPRGKAVASGVRAPRRYRDSRDVERVRPAAAREGRTRSNAHEHVRNRRVAARRTQRRSAPPDRRHRRERDQRCWNRHASRARRALFRRTQTRDRRGYPRLRASCIDRRSRFGRTFEIDDDRGRLRRGQSAVRPQRCDANFRAAKGRDAGANRTARARRAARRLRRRRDARTRSQRRSGSGCRRRPRLRVRRLSRRSLGTRRRDRRPRVRSRRSALERIALLDRRRENRSANAARENGRRRRTPGRETRRPARSRSAAGSKAMPPRR